MASADLAGAFLLFLAWGLYFLLHSILASLKVKGAVKSRFPDLYRWYRLAYNLLSLILLLPLLALMRAMAGPPLWSWRGPLFLLSTGLALLAIAGFIMTLRYYKTDEFTGTAQLKGEEEGTRGFTLSPFHRYVRHPWYFLGLVILWTRDMDLPLLVTAAAVTLYFVIGSRLEEEKLIKLYGERYRRYRQWVPGLFPLPWRYLTAAEAKEILELSEAGLKEED